MLMELVFLPAILFLGIITSYQDIKYGKIKNKWIVMSLVYVFIAYTLLIIYFIITESIRYAYFVDFFSNLLSALLIGFGLWFIGIWSAGDGKLFIAYSALIPLSFYQHSYVKWFPGFILLINIFIIGFIAILFLFLLENNFKNIRKKSIIFIKKFFDLKKILYAILYIFSVFWMIQIFLSLIKLEENMILIIVFTILIVSIIQTYLNKYPHFIIIIIFIAILRLFFDKNVYSVKFLIDFIVIMIIFQFVRIFTKEDLSKSPKKEDTVPFAPLIFTGVIITLIIKSNIFFFIRLLF